MSNQKNDLINLLKEKLVIPFIGSGFSTCCGLPSWEKLIEHLLKKFDINKNDIKDKSDFLRITEYLKILTGGKIGPIRSEMQNLFNEQSIDISQSEPHLHLVSLDVPIIYTTNYDNLIEKTYEYLKIDFNKVVTIRDIVKSAYSNFTQVIKFHGSFEHEETMVLTESDYFSRLEFETPIDIKFRSDILGKSILFMGYSFTDFNIRYLWFKLRKMIKSDTEKDIPKSFIVIESFDKIMDLLFKNMGILPIYINKYKGYNYTEKICEFLEYLIIGVNKKSNWPFEMPVIATNIQINKMIESIQNEDDEIALRYLWLLNNSRFGEKQIEYLKKTKINPDNKEFKGLLSFVEKTNLKVRRQLIELLLKLEIKYDFDYYNILIISFLRYREARDADEMMNWKNFTKIMQRKKLSSECEFQMLFDALIWINFSNDLRRDTTLYFLLFIAVYFENKMDEIILNPNMSHDLKNFPNEYYNIKPQKVVKYMYEKAPWLPNIGVLIENEFDRICEALHCDFQKEEEFQWKFDNADKNIIEKIFHNSKSQTEI